MKTELQTVSNRSVPLSTLLPVALGFLMLSGNASAVDFTLDTTTVMTAIGVVFTAVSAVALAAVVIPLVIKGVKYLRAAF